MEPDKTTSSSKMLVEDVEQQVKELLPSLPKTLEGTISEMVLYEEFWCPKYNLPGVISSQRCFQAQETDIIVASNPKSGTTWLKALIFSVVNRTRYSPSNTPLLTSNPHDLVPFIHHLQFPDKQVGPHDLTTIASRIVSTHLPFPALPESIKQSKCQIVYICRNPFDAAVSHWHHSREMGLYKDGEMAMEDFFDVYFEGKSWYGPYWDHVLGYWKESLEKPNEVLFLKYEDLKEDIVPCLKRIAEFIAYPFSEEEDRDGVIEEIVKLCSLSNFKNLEVNQKGKFLSKFPNKDFFRKGKKKKASPVHYASPLSEP